MYRWRRRRRRRGRVVRFAARGGRRLSRRSRCTPEAVAHLFVDDLLQDQQQLEGFASGMHSTAVARIGLLCIAEAVAHQRGPRNPG